MSDDGEPPESLFHATSVTIDGRALLIAGASGSGKSDLALRLIDRGARLLSDDYTRIARRGDRLVALSAPRIEGMMEVRGIGIVELDHVAEAPVALILDLDAPVDRLPPEELPASQFHGLSVPVLPLAAFEASAPIKAEQALLRHGIARP